MIFNPQEAQTQKAALYKQVAAAHRNAVMIVLAIGFSIGIYVAIGLILLGQASSSSDYGSDYRMHFAIAAGMLAFASIAYRRSQHGRTRLEVITTLRGTQGLLRHFVLTTVIAAALGEVIGLLALAIAFFGGAPRDILIIGLVGMFIVFSSYPRLGAWQKTVAYYDSISYQDAEQGSERK